MKTMPDNSTEISQKQPIVTAFWDTETNGLLPDLTKLHSLGIDFSPDNNTLSCADQPGYPSITSGLQALEKADIRVAHNGQDFDERAVRKIYPWFKPKPSSVVLDTLLLSRLIYPALAKQGPNTHKVIPRLCTSHSLKAWGQRLGEFKGDYDGGDWSTWDPEMQVYMDQDVKLLKRLFKHLMSQKPDPRSVKIEHDFASIIRRQEAWGFTFNYTKASTLQADLQRQERELESALVSKYGEWWEPGTVVTIKGTREVKMLGYPDITVKRVSPSTGKELKPYVGPPKISYEAGAKYTPITRVLFSPRSRDHVRLILARDHGWKPTKFTDKGTPQVDDEVLRALPYPEAQQIGDFYVIMKILGTLSAGKKAWLKSAKHYPDKNIWIMHGRVNTNGTYTGRCTHSDPNGANVPAVDSAKNPLTGEDEVLFGLLGGYGYESRDLFKARDGYKLVGVDASGIQLRGLGHYVARWDGGNYAHIIANEDPHAWLRDTVGTDIMGEGKAGRAHGKTVGYALIFGGGDYKLGSIVAPDESKAEKIRIGKFIKDRLAERFAPLTNLQGLLKEAVQTRGYLIGLDGRKLPVQKPHAALASLLQGFEGVAMKLALTILDKELQTTHGLRCGVLPSGQIYHNADYEFVANVHDEFQADVKPAIMETFIGCARECIPEAGLILKVKCPLVADIKVGNSWAETH